MKAILPYMLKREVKIISTRISQRNSHAAVCEPDMRKENARIRNNCTHNKDTW